MVLCRANLLPTTTMTHAHMHTWALTHSLARSLARSHQPQQHCFCSVLSACLHMPKQRPICSMVLAGPHPAPHRAPAPAPPSVYTQQLSQQQSPCAPCRHHTHACTHARAPPCTGTQMFFWHLLVASTDWQFGSGHKYIY